MSNGAAPIQQTVLTVHFQGICAFLRNAQSLANTTEVTAAFMAGELASETPKLCAHSPVLIFEAEKFVSSTGQVSHTTALLPDAGSHCPALGIWPLAGRDIRIGGAPAADLSLSPTFSSVADFDQILGGNGAAGKDCLDPQPPAGRIIKGRFILTSGRLSVSALVGDSGQANDLWVFADENVTPTGGAPIIFAQEIQYDFFSSTPVSTVVLTAGPMGSPSNETLTLTAGARVAISNLCAIDLGPVQAERDFLAYYALLATKPSQRLIPQRIPDQSGQVPVRIGLSACPPGTTFV